MSRRVLFAPPEPERGTRSGRPKGHVSLNELLQVFWRQKLLIVLVVIGVMVPAYVATQLVTPKYESTATLDADAEVELRQ